MNERYKSALAISEVHVKRISLALSELSNSIPLTTDKIANLSVEEILYLELLTNRFVKLQDYMGNTLFDMCIEKLGDVSEGLTIIDKVNKLAKAKIIASESAWREFRATRNHISHEYPDRPDLVAKFINVTIGLVPELIQCEENIRKCLSK